MAVTAFADEVKRVRRLGVGTGDIAVAVGRTAGDGQRLGARDSPADRREARAVHGARLAGRPTRARDVARGTCRSGCSSRSRRSTTGGRSSCCRRAATGTSRGWSPSSRTSRSPERSGGGPRGSGESRRRGGTRPGAGGATGSAARATHPRPGHVVAPHPRGRGAVLLDRRAGRRPVAAGERRPRHLPGRFRADRVGGVVPPHLRGGRPAGAAHAASGLADRGRPRGRRGSHRRGHARGARIERLDPTRRQWPETQPVGEAYYRDGARAILAPSAARRGGQVLAVFRRGRPRAASTAVPPPTRHDRLPASLAGCGPSQTPPRPSALRRTYPGQPTSALRRRASTSWSVPPLARRSRPRSAAPRTGGAVRRTSVARGAAARMPATRRAWKPASSVLKTPPARTISGSSCESRRRRISARAIATSSSARRSTIDRATASPTAAASNTSGASSDSRRSDSRSK